MLQTCKVKHLIWSLWEAFVYICISRKIWICFSQKNIFHLTGAQRIQTNHKHHGLICSIYPFLVVGDDLVGLHVVVPGLVRHKVNYLVLRLKQRKTFSFSFKFQFYKNPVKFKNWIFGVQSRLDKKKILFIIQMLVLTNNIK